MRKLKPLFAILLAVTVILLSGCANVQSLLPKNDANLYELTAISQKADIYTSIDISGDNVLFLTASGTDSYELTVYNALNDRITAEKNLSDCPLEYITGAIFNSDNGIYVYDELNEKAVIYDLNLNQIGTADYVVVYDHEIASTLVNDTYAYLDTFAYTYEGGNFYVLFYNSPETVYVFDGRDKMIFSENQRRLLTGKLDQIKSDKSLILTLAVEDLDNSLCIDEAKLDTVPNGYFADVTLSALSDKYACFVERISNDQTGGESVIPYLWKYTENPTASTSDVKKMTEGDFENDNARLISELEDRYGIGIKTNEPPEFGFECDCTASPIQINMMLSSLSDCLDLFPKNFVKEIYKDAEYVNGLNIHIVENIDGATAFTNDFSETYEIAFGYRGFSDSVVFHELMHLIDNRIQTYYDENNMDFYGEWWTLNPPGFEYYYDDDHDINEEYFVSHYAMTNVGEDLADTFQTMFEAYEYGGDFRFSEYEHVKEKADLLSEAIRKAFPSMANADEVCWEKYAEYNN